MEEKGKRDNTGKVKWSLLPDNTLIPMIRVLEFGAIKYAPHNWKKGLPVTEICESLKRHLISFMEGEDIDQESLQEHIGHIQANAMFLSYMMMYRPDLDDRYIDPNIYKPNKKF